MNISLISFTQNGANLGRILLAFLSDQDYDASAFTMGEYAKGLEAESIKIPLEAWTNEQFEKADGIIFVGAVNTA